MKGDGGPPSFLPAAGRGPGKERSWYLMRIPATQICSGATCGEPWNIGRAFRRIAGGFARRLGKAPGELAVLPVDTVQKTALALWEEDSQ